MAAPTVPITPPGSHHPGIPHPYRRASRRHRRGGRQCARVVRLRPVRLLRPRDRGALLSRRRPHRFTPRRLRHLRRRVPHAAGGRGTLRLGGRSLRPEAGAHLVGARDGLPLVLHRPPPRYRDDRARRPGAAAPVPADAGTRGGRGVHGLGRVPGRRLPTRPARVDGKLGPAGRERGDASRFHGGRAGEPGAAAGGGDGLRLADSVPGGSRRRARRARHPAPLHGAGAPSGAGQVAPGRGVPARTGVPCSTWWS